MHESFGARLRQRREERQIDLIAIAEQTKIKLSLLEGLEKDDVSHWPTGIFRRAYLKTYAQFIGLDPDLVVREFLERYPDPGDAYTAVVAAAEVLATARKDGPPPTRLRTMMDSALARLRRGSAVEEPASVAVTPSPVAFERVSHEAPEPTLEVAVPVSSERFPEPAFALELDPAAPAVDVIDKCVDLEPMEIACDAGVEQPPAVAAELPREAPVAFAAAAPEPPRVMQTDDAAVEALVSVESKIAEVARVCSGLGEAVDRAEVQRLMADAASVLDAAGLIVWLWDETADVLRPALAQGYPDRLVAHLPSVHRDADNATAAAFRSASACEVAPTPQESGALVVPMLVPDLCTGVLAIELQPGDHATRLLGALAALLAAALAQVVYRSQPARVRPPVEAPAPAAPAVMKFRAPARPARVRR